MNLVIKLLVYTLAVFVASYLLPGVVVSEPLDAVIAAVLLVIIYTAVKPVLNLLTLPITILTLGLFSLVINGLLILLVDAVVPGFAVENFWWAVLFSLVMSIVVAVLETLAPEGKSHGAKKQQRQNRDRD